MRFAPALLVVVAALVAGCQEERTPATPGAGTVTTTTVGVASTQVPGMKRIAAGDRDASYLLHKLRGTHTTVGGFGERMPRNGPPYLSDSDIDRIGAFIDAL